jgi:CRISPR/Cas system-associated exonuclease Cas4 (RecB family)
MDKIQEVREFLPIESLYEGHQLAKNDRMQARDTDGAFHPSQMGSCTRKLWYAACMMSPKHRIDPKLRCTFEHGHAVHDWQQRELGDLLEKLSQHNIKLDGGYGTRFDAEFEVSLNDPAYSNGVADGLNIKGSADGLIIVQDDFNEYTRVIYELKTMADASWQKLTKPQAKHIAQATIYARCLDGDVILFQYYNKNSDISKFFYVEPDAVAWQNACNQVNTVREALDNGVEVDAEYSMWECKSCGYYYDCKPELRQQGDTSPFRKG